MFVIVVPDMRIELDVSLDPTLGCGQVDKEGRYLGRCARERDNIIEADGGWFRMLRYR